MGNTRASPTGEEIRDFRERNRMTQVQLAKALGVHPSTIQKWENNAVRPRGLARSALVTMLAQAGSVSPDGDGREDLVGSASGSPPGPGSEEQRTASRVLAEVEARLRDRMRREFEGLLVEEALSARRILHEMSHPDRRVVRKFLEDVARLYGATGFSRRTVSMLAERDDDREIAGLFDGLSAEALLAELKRAGRP